MIPSHINVPKLSILRDYSSTLSREPEYDKFAELEETLFEPELKRIYTECEKIRTTAHWADKGTKNGVDLATCWIDGSDYLCCRGSRTVGRSDINVEAVLVWVEDASIDPGFHPEFKKDLDPDVFYIAGLHDFGPQRRSHVLHLRLTTSVPFVSDRDFILLRRTEKVGPNAWAIYGGDFAHNDEAPFPAEDSSVVRGHVYRYMWWISQDPATGKIDAEYFTHSNPCGWIPAGLYNMFVTDEAQCMERYWSMFLQRRDAGLPVMSDRKRRILAGETLTEDEDDENVVVVGVAGVTEDEYEGEEYEGEVILEIVEEQVVEEVVEG